MIHRHFILTPALIAILLGSFMLGCGSGSAKKSDSTPVSVASPPAFFGTELVTREEAEEFGRQMEQAVAGADIAKCLELFDLNLLIEHAYEGLELPTQFGNSIRAELSTDRGLYGQIVSHVQHGGSYKLLRVRKKTNGYHALFRLLTPGESGVNYHDYLLTKGQQGVIAPDIYVFINGEYVSANLRRTAIPVAAHQNRSVLQRLTQHENDSVKHVGKIAELVSSIQNEDAQTALTIYDSLPESLREQKNVLFLRIAAAQKIEGNEQLYLDALSDYRKLFPNDPSLLLISIDYFVLRKQHNKALNTIIQLDASLGGDPYLAVLMAARLIEMGKLDEAVKLCQDAIALEGDLIELRWAIVNVYLAQDDHPETLKALVKVDQNFAQTAWFDLSTIPEYLRFTESKEHDEWLKYLGSK